MRIIHIPAGSPRGEDHFLVLTSRGQAATWMKTDAEGNLISVQMIARDDIREAREGAFWFVRRRAGYVLEV